MRAAPFWLYGQGETAEVTSSSLRAGIFVRVSLAGH